VQQSAVDQRAEPQAHPASVEQVEEPQLQVQLRDHQHQGEAVRSQRGY
jgi:hypothetical protein